jgi:hypothetical protein
MTRDEQHAVWIVLSKQIDALRPRVNAAYDVWNKSCTELDKLERERSRLWREWVDEFSESIAQ